MSTKTVVTDPERAIRGPIPTELVEMLQGRPDVESVEQAFPFVTTDPEGFPHVALLSRTEVQATRDGGEVLAVLASRRTCANLRRGSHATLIAVGSTTAYYLKLRVAELRDVDGALGCRLRPAQLTEDSLGIPLSPISFRTSGELATTEHWDRTAAVLSVLRDSGKG